MHVTGRTKPHPHDDAPDTAAAFERLGRLPEGPERHALRDDLVRAWLPMAERIAVRFRGRGEALEDLYQVAAVGLVKAVDHYDPGRGTAFEAYAVPTVTGEIKRHFRDHLWALHVPRRVQDLRNRVRHAAKDLSATVPGRPPTVAEIAAYTQLSESEVRTGMEALDCFSTLSLEAELPGTDGYALADTVGGPDPGFDLVVDRAAVSPCLRNLPERERTILYLRFFGGMTQSRIAQQLGISQMHVSRLISGCCARMREELRAELCEEQPGEPSDVRPDERSGKGGERYEELLADACRGPAAGPPHTTVARASLLTAGRLGGGLTAEPSRERFPSVPSPPGLPEERS